MHLLWYHASLRDALKNESSDGVQAMIDLVLSSSPFTFKLPLLATEVTYREIEAALVVADSCPGWLIDFMRQLVKIIIAPVQENAPNQDDDSDEIDYGSATTIELIEASRCSASRLVCLLIDQSVSDPVGHTSNAFLESVHVKNSATQDTSSFMYAKKKDDESTPGRSATGDDSRTLFKCLDDSVKEVLQVTSAVSVCRPAQEARRMTLLNELLHSFYSTLILPSTWANHNERNQQLWGVLQKVVSTQERGVGDLNACLGAACLLIGGADVSTKEPSLVSKYYLPSNTLWSLISLGLSSNKPLERRRAMHLLRTVVLLATTADTTPNTKQANHQQGSKKKSNQSKTRVVNGNEWMSFLKAFEIYDNEFQLHLVEQVWPLLRGLCNGNLTDTEGLNGASEEEGTAALTVVEKPFWLHPLPAMSYAMVRLLFGRSLSSENPAVVKFGLEKLFRGETFNLSSKDPSLLFPPRWIRQTLIHDTLDDAKLVCIHNTHVSLLFVC